ncbi:hypothetical protein GXW78_14080 [Roseomonas terrae]|uniref:Secreted protein n=1 Tax=Neoroseomonas terrae TaxID=424799 RepID=A0ABS5EIE8_9PROT|nr:hypothetical protein [Neoroseomonas terrae]MBR0650800.1 hypothetical protein [Neoroseomonas terrae]
MRSIPSGLLALLLTSGAALAQPATAPNTAAAAALQRAQAFIASSGCPSATARPAAPPARFTDPTVREATYHRILIEGCGRRMQRNYLAVVMPDGASRMVETLPGTTVTDPVLQRDAMQAATAAARVAAPNCQQIRPQAADFDGQDSESTATRRTRAWTENWVFEACGQMLAVPMRFTPSPRGGTDFSASSSAVRRLN